MPIFEFTDTSEIDTAWQIDCGAAQTGFHDVMAIVFRDGPTSPWRAVWRFRYYVDGKVWDSADRKNAYEMRARDTNDPQARARMVDAMDLMAALLRADGAIVHRLPINGDAQKFAEIWARSPGGHVDIPEGPTGLRGPDQPQ